jgi:hypothetical protein
MVREETATGYFLDDRGPSPGVRPPRAHALERGRAASRRPPLTGTDMPA